MKRLTIKMIPVVLLGTICLSNSYGMEDSKITSEISQEHLMKQMRLINSLEDRDLEFLIKAQKIVRQEALTRGNLIKEFFDGQKSIQALFNSQKPIPELTQKTVNQIDDNQYGPILIKHIRNRLEEYYEKNYCYRNMSSEDMLFLVLGEDDEERI